MDRMVCAYTFIPPRSDQFLQDVGRRAAAVEEGFLPASEPFAGRRRRILQHMRYSAELGRGRGSSIGTLTRSSDTLTEAASSGTSTASIKASSISCRSATASAPTRCATRSKLAREYGSRPNSCAVACASRDVPCCTASLIARAVRGNHPSPTTPARKLTASTTLPPGCPPRSPDCRYNDRSTDTEPLIVW